MCAEFMGLLLFFFLDQNSEGRIDYMLHFVSVVSLYEDKCITQTETLIEFYFSYVSPLNENLMRLFAGSRD